MLRILTSLSFLYAFVIVILLLYGWIYYRDFVRSRYQRRRFPLVFLLIGLACFSFLWINLHAPLKLKTFSNLDHQFIRLDGFNVTGSIELGRTDTVNGTNNPFSRFLFAKKNDSVTVRGEYAEEPFYVLGEKGYRIVSVNYPAVQHMLSFHAADLQVTISTPSETIVEMKIGEAVFKKELILKKGSSCWNLFRDEDAFINNIHYNEERLVSALKNIFLLRDDVSKRKGGELKYFLSGRLFSEAKQISYDGQAVQIAGQSFSAVLPDNGRVAWGIGFLDNNRNQFRITYGGKDSFTLLNQYPVAYPLTEEDRNNWEEHGVTKFLVADGKDMAEIPAVFREGFLFPSFSEDEASFFSPVLLSYQKASRDQPLQMTARWLDRPAKPIAIANNHFFLPAKQSGFNWSFSIRNTYDWEFGNRVLPAATWQALLFGSLAIFFLLIFFTALIQPAARQSWVWQLLCSITLVLLTTRFLLYWRYKSFPPYEGMDLPSQQQLQSFGNFGIILFATIILGLVFGFSFLRYAYLNLRIRAARLLRKPYHGFNSMPDEQQLLNRFEKMLPRTRRISRKTWFFGTWTSLLLLSGAFAALNHFDPGVCRHIAIAFILIYFVYLYISYKFSPLVASSGISWWTLGTGKTLDIIISNPVKILLSVSLLGLFVFIDIGFAIVFLNFLLFNEAFLCINYGIAGLSAGSKRNSTLFGMLGAIYMLAFVLNLLYAPYIFKFLLELPQVMYITAYFVFAISIAYVVVRLLSQLPSRKKNMVGLATSLVFFALAFFFFPKERILDKAAMTKYRIDVLTTPVEKAIAGAYEEGKTYEPVIRAAQNQWFINTFIYEGNNPAVQSAGFTLLPHAPQNKGAKYNAQATDLVASRFLIGEHGKWAVLLYVFLLILPTTMLASFYKLYPDFTNRINNNYPRVTAGFSILNYLLITALLVILAATGRYIFFGQDLPFGSILSKQSILFPCLLILAAMLFFRQLPLEHYANRRKVFPGIMVFSLLILLLFVVKPDFNKNKEFAVAELAKEMDGYIQANLQPVMDHFDTSAATRRWPLAKKDQFFTDSVRSMIAAGLLQSNNKFFSTEVLAYARSGFSRHMDQRRMLYLDISSSGSPQLSVNDNYFRVEAPPHLQQLWKGNVFSDTGNYNISVWNAATGKVINKHMREDIYNVHQQLSKELVFSFNQTSDESQSKALYLLNALGVTMDLRVGEKIIKLNSGDSLRLSNPFYAVITDAGTKQEQVLSVQPDAFMKNYYVNGSRFYVYPMASRFIWARNFSEAVASDYTAAGDTKRNAFVSLDFGIMDSLSGKIRTMMERDTAYKKGAEYGICIADGNGRIVAMSDFIKGLHRPDPNDKTAFNKVLTGEDGFISQSLLRKQIGNINLLRLNPGPGSTLKPIVFSAIASQLDLDWDNFQTEGFSEKQHYYGGAKVAEYDFEKNNGLINKVTDYIRYSDNYYHSNVLLLGSYPKQALQPLLANQFTEANPGGGLHWPYFNYQGKRYWLNGFNKWPAYQDGKADFGTDSSFASIGLNDNYGIYTRQPERSFDMLGSRYDSSLFLNAWRKSGFILPENALFDQTGEQVNHRIAYDLFTTCFRGHVKGSSQVRIPPARMVEAIGKMTSQNRNYALTLDPYAVTPEFLPFYVDKSIIYNNYLSLIRENVFAGMREALFNGTAARLGMLLKNGAPYYYYGKTGTTGDDEVKTKSKLFTLVISLKDITDPDYNFRNNRFYTIYFTSQNGPASQNEEFQAEIINYLQSSEAFINYMKGIK